jgi:hypothetical protein
MAQVRYQVIFSQDGMPSVSVSSDDPQALEQALSDVSRLRQKLLGGSIPEARPATQQPADTSSAPVCPIHNHPLSWVDRNGGFWSCHKKNPDGSWCSYRPQGRSQSAGVATPLPY